MMKWGVKRKDFFISFLVLLYSVQVVICMEDDTPCPSMCKCPKTSMRVKIKCMRVGNLEELDLRNLPLPVVQLDLSENVLTKIPSDSFTFPSLKLLQKLNLSRNNIESLDPDVFGNLTNLKRLDLSHNKLQNLGYSVFNGLESLERLSLSQNHLVRIPDGLFEPLLSLKQLDLSGNPLHCDCKLLWLLEWVQNSSVKLSPSPKCSSPSVLRGQPIRKLYVEHSMLCDSTVDSTNQQLELKPAHNQVVFEGDPLQLRCSVPSIFENRNEVTLSWLYGNQDALSTFQEIEVEDQYYSDRGLIESSLSIKHLVQEHSGQWYCQLVSEHGNHTQAIRVIVISDKTQYCPQKETVTNKGCYLWPKTVVGFTVELPCKPQKSGLATALKAHYTCSSDGNWDFLNTSACPYVSETTKILEQFSRVNLSISKETVLESAARLKNFIGDGKQLHDKMDIVFISKMIENYLSYIMKEKELAALLVDIVSTLINLPKELMRAAQLEDKACSRLVNAVENVAEFTSSLQSHKSNLAVEVNRVKRDTFAGLSCTWFVHSSKLSGRWFHCSTSNATALFGGTRVIEASVQIPPSLFYQLEKQGISTFQPQQLLVSMYENNNFFPRVSTNGEKDIASCIIGTKLVGQEVQNLTEPVYVMFKAPDSLYHYSDSPLPVWWDSSLDNGLGGWNEKGCHLSHYLHGLLVFQCNRLGYFGLLQKSDLFYSSNTRATGAKFRFSHPVIYIGSFFCIVSLMVAIVTYAICHTSIQMSKKAKHSLTNTWIAMAMLCFMYSAGIHQTEDIKVCQGVGLVLHYLSLSSLLWMTVTASNMYKRLTKSDSLDTLPEDELPPDQPVAQKPLLGLYLVGWGIALIVCGISGAVNMPLYASHWHCFLSTGPSLGAVFVPAGILVTFLFVVFLLIHCAARNIDANGQHSEGTQVTENVDLDMLDSHITNNGVAERTSLRSTSAPTASSEVEDPEHSPVMQLKAHVIVLVLYLFTWASAALATAKPFKKYFSYEETAFSILYGFLSISLGAFVLFFYCIARSDVRSQWHLVRCWCKKKRGRCCRTRSISDTNPALPHTQPVPTTVVAHSGGVVVSSTNSVNSSHKSQNSNAAKAATELNGIVQTVVKSDMESGGSSENKSNVDLVVLHRQMYRSNNSVTTYTELSGASGAEMFYNPHQSTVARKFFRKQRRQAKAVNLCPRRSGDGIRENDSGDLNVPAENTVFLSSDIDNMDKKKHCSKVSANISHKSNDLQNFECMKDSSAREPTSDSGMPLERLVIGAEEAPEFKPNPTGRDVRNSIDPVEEVSEEVTSMTAEVGETESDLQCGLTTGSADCVSELGSESVSCRTSNGALSTSYDTQNCRTDHCSWQEHLDVPSDMAGSDNCSYKSSECNPSSNSLVVYSDRTQDGISEKDGDVDVRSPLGKFSNLISNNVCMNGLNGDQIIQETVMTAYIDSNPTKGHTTSKNVEGCVCDNSSYPICSDQFVNKRETSV